MKKERNYELTLEILGIYQSAALENAGDLIREADCLLRSQHWSRAYFLACSSIEETGKALQAFMARGRNLRDPGIQHKIKRKFEDHRTKNLTALICLLFEDPEKVKDRKLLDFIVDTSLALQVGREKSMYVDIGSTGKITIPNAILPERNARDTVNLAKVLLDKLIEHTRSNTPRKTSKWEDKHFVIPPEKLMKIMQNENFWKFMINKLTEGHKFDLSEFTVKYYEDYFCKNTSFQEAGL